MDQQGTDANESPIQMNEIRDLVKGLLGTETVNKLGITQEQLDKSLLIAGSVTREVVEDTASEQPAIAREIILNEVVTPDARKFWERVRRIYVQRINKELGINALNAAALKDAILPL